MKFRIERCTEDWLRMAGDERCRHCKKCSKTVVNLSAGTEAAAKKLLAEDRPLPCVRLTHAPGGRVLFERGTRRALGVAAALALAACGPDGLEQGDGGADRVQLELGESNQAKPTEDESRASDDVEAEDDSRGEIDDDPGKDDGETGVTMGILIRPRATSAEARPEEPPKSSTDNQ